MRGAIAAGHPITAEVGARVLADGGNAVDACIAAAFASWVSESTLTGPGGGGFMAVHRGRDGSTRVLDFFVTVPGLGGPALDRGSPQAMDSVAVDFTPESSQVFHIGAASCAVPGVVAGLEGAHRAYATMPWAELIAPAVELARDGLVVTPSQAYLHAILDPVLRHTSESREIYGDEEQLQAGDVLRMADLAGTLELLATDGAAALYRGELAEAIVEHLGGVITPRDLAEYRVVRRRPVRAAFLGHELDSNPPPSTGGVLIAYALRLLDRVGVGGPAGSAGAITRLVEVMAEQGRARDGRFFRDLYQGGLARRLLDEGTIAQGAGRIEARERALREPSGSPGTTHISVVDAADNAASLTATTGSGSGVVVPGTGIHLNNMLGEFDLATFGGRHQPPGRRMTSMMAPTIVLRNGRARLVVGSAGSLRLRGAILQIVVNTVAHDLPVEEAIDHPRIHLEEPEVHCEGGVETPALDALQARGYAVVRWRGRNLYFGGAAAVGVAPDGTLAAAGDPRRGGAGITVEDPAPASPAP